MAHQALSSIGKTVGKFLVRTWPGRAALVFMLFVSTPYLWVTPWFIHFSWPGFLTQALYVYGTGRSDTLCVTQSFPTTNDQTGKKEYQVWGRYATEKPNAKPHTFKVQDSWWRGVTRSADTFGQLTPKECFEVKLYGWRLGVLSLKPNIVAVYNSVPNPHTPQSAAPPKK